MVLVSPGDVRTFSSYRSQYVGDCVGSPIPVLVYINRPRGTRSTPMSSIVRAANLLPEELQMLNTEVIELDIPVDA